MSISAIKNRLSRVKRKAVSLLNRVGSHPPPLQTFSYKPPAREGALKQVTRLCKSEHMRASIQIIQKEFNENLHSHRGIDGLWIILRGRASFLGPDDQLLGECGPMEGIFIPRNTRYRYESTGDEALEVLQVLSFPGGAGWDRTEHETRNGKRGTVARHDGRQQAMDESGV